MADTGIKRDISEISKEIANLEKDSQKAAKQVRELQADLRFDPNNIIKINEKYQVLTKRLETLNKLQAQYNNLISRKQTQLDSLDPATTEAKELAKEIENLGKKANKVADNIHDLNAQLNSTQAASEKAKSAIGGIDQKFKVAENAAQKLARATAVLTAALTLLWKKAVDTGNELYSLSVRYDASAESLQKYNRQLEIATGQTDLYTSALATLSNGFKEIVSGRGIAYEQALKNIGLASKDLIGLSMEERYQAIFEALQNVSDESVRTANAQKLLGDAGAYIAQTAGMTADELERVNALTQQYGILSDEQVEQLHNAYIAQQNFNSQLMIIGADLLPAILPLIKQFADMARSLADGINSLGEGGAKAMVILLLAVTLLPKVIAFTKTIVTWNYLRKASVDSVTASTVALNAVSAQWQIILIAVAGVILLILGIIGKVRRQTSDATDEMSTLIDKANILNGVGGDFASTAEMTTTYQNERTIEIGVEIHAAGDTMISDDSATKVALITADQIQKQLGGLVL